MEHRDYSSILLRYWKVIGAASLIGAVIGGALGVVLHPAVPVQVYTVTVQSVLLTPQASADYEALFEKAQSYTATTSASIQIQSPSKTLNNQDFTETRLNFYLDILLTEATLASLSDVTGLTPSELRNKVELSNLNGTGLVYITVFDRDRTKAQQLSKALVDELGRRVAATETGLATIENLGTVVTAPTLSDEASAASATMARRAAAQQVIAADPLAVGAGAAGLASLFGDSEFQKLSQGLTTTRTPEQLKASLVFTAWVPATSSSDAGILISASDPNAETATQIATDATTLLQDRIAADMGIDDSAISPLVDTGVVVSDGGVTTGADSATGGNRTRLNVLLGLLIGMAAGVGYAFVHASRDATIRNVGQLLDVTGQTPVWALDAITAPDSNHWVTLSDSTQGSESYRVLRSNLMFGLPDARVLTVTSADGDPAAEVAINLAIALSQAGESVILVEADLRMPRVAAALALGDGKGLNSVLDGTCNIADAVQLWDVGALSVLVAEYSLPNPSEMLSRGKFQELLNELRSRFAYVIIVTPSVLSATDAAVVASRSDGVLLCLHHGRTTTLQFEAAVSLLVQVGAFIPGVVVTDIPPNEVNAWRVAGNSYYEPSPEIP